MQAEIEPPLAGIKVLDLTQLLPGPLATLMLAEAGATVTKVESPTGDGLREYEPFHGETGAAYQLLNRGKAIVTIDLKSLSGLSQIRELIAHTDVLVTQSRPGTLEKRGLAAGDLMAAHPRLIVCSISGYGQDGPRAYESGHDLNYAASAGLLGLGGAPAVPPVLLADIAGGTYPAVINILLALRRRDLTGKGSHLDIAMTDAMLVFAWETLAWQWATGSVPPERLHFTGASPRYRIYETRDARFVAVAAVEEPLWQRFVKAIGLASNYIDDRSNPAATCDAVQAVISVRTASEWEPIFQAADCCATIVRTTEEALADSHFASRGVFVRARYERELPALPLPISPGFRRPS